MQAQLNFTFDLGSAAGRAEFQRMFRHLLTSDPLPSLPEDRQGMPLAPDLPEPVRANPSSVPDDPDRAAAAKAGRQEAAAKARAAKAAKAEAGNGPIEKVLGPADNGADLSGPEPNGQGTASLRQDQAVEDDLGLVDPNMSPAEAKEAGLALVREAYAAGKVAQVKQLQKAWGIAKFYDIPNEKGHEFFAAVMKLAHETGLRK
jgi:hypothetical protein